MESFGFVDKALSRIQKANNDGDPKEIVSCVKEYDDYIEISDEQIKDLSSEAREQFYNGMEEYKKQYDISIAKLNSHIKNELDGFKILTIDKKITFLEAVEALVNTDEIINVDRVCKMLLECLISASEKDEPIFQKIYKIMTIEKIDPSVKDENGVPKKQVWFGNYFGDNDQIPHLLKKAYGKNYKILKAIFMKINNIEMPLFEGLDNKLSCSIMSGGDCNKFVPSGNSYFIAFPFSKKELKYKILEGCSKTFRGLEPKITQDVFANTTLLCKVCQDILSSRFGIYVLNKYSLDKGRRFILGFLNRDKRKGKRYLPNSNVTLELGLAIGHNKKFIMLVEKGTEIISDLQGYIRIEYDNINDIPAKIQQHNFTDFYYEES